MHQHELENKNNAEKKYCRMASGIILCTDSQFQFFTRHLIKKEK
jgi:hypothetical protein